MPFRSDFNDTMDPLISGVLGDSYTYSGTAYQGAFIEAYNEAASERLGMEVTAPMLKVIDSDVTGISNGDTLIYNGITYTVRNQHPDGTGMTFLVLEEP